MVSKRLSLKISTDGFGEKNSLNMPRHVSIATCNLSRFVDFTQLGFTAKGRDNQNQKKHELLGCRWFGKSTTSNASGLHTSQLNSLLLNKFILSLALKAEHNTSWGPWNCRRNLLKWLLLQLSPGFQDTRNFNTSECTTVRTSIQAMCQTKIQACTSKQGVQDLWETHIVSFRPFGIFPGNLWC